MIRKLLLRKSIIKFPEHTQHVSALTLFVAVVLPVTGEILSWKYLKIEKQDDNVDNCQSLQYSETCIGRNRMGTKIFSTLDKFPHYTK
jgi:hypothetical protein